MSFYIPFSAREYSIVFVLLTIWGCVLCQDSNLSRVELISQKESVAFHFEEVEKNSLLTESSWGKYFHPINLWIQVNPFYNYSEEKKRNLEEFSK